MFHFPIPPTTPAIPNITKFQIWKYVTLENKKMLPVSYYLYNVCSHLYLNTDARFFICHYAMCNA